VRPYHTYSVGYVKYIIAIQHSRFLPIDLSYYFPFGGWLRAAGMLGDGEVMKAIDAVGLGSNPGYEIPKALATNQDGLGREIWDPGDPTWEQAQDIASYLIGQALPPTFPQAGQLVQAIRGVPDRWGNPQRTPAEAALRLAGIRVDPMDVRIARMRESYQHEAKIRDAEQRRSEIRRDRSLSPAARQQALERQNKHIAKLKQERAGWLRKVQPAMGLAR
jgi:hypothetical protein